MADFDAAVVAAKFALELMEDRRGPRSFWPPHAWELAACHHFLALALAGLGSFEEAIAALKDIEPLVSPASMKAATPHLANALMEDTRALKLECEVANCIADARRDVTSSSSVLQTLLNAAEVLLGDTRGTQVRGRLLALAALLTLLCELPWHVAGGSRAEALETASAQLASARGLLGPITCVRRVAPGEAACAAMLGDAAGAASRAEAWAREAERLGGSSSSSSSTGRDLAMEAREAAAGLAEAQPQILKRMLCGALRRPGSGELAVENDGGIAWDSVCA